MGPTLSSLFLLSPFLFVPNATQAAISLSCGLVDEGAHGSGRTHSLGIWASTRRYMLRQAEDFFPFLSLRIMLTYLGYKPNDAALLYLL